MMIPDDQHNRVRRRGRILVADDNSTNLSILSFMLADADYEIFMASDGFEALEMAPEIQPDLILLDVMMPGMDGFETCQRLKQTPVLENTPVIFMTALHDNANKMRGFEVGAVDYLTKPFHLPELMARIKIHLRFALSYQALVRESLQQVRNLQEAQQILLPNPEAFPQAKYAYRFIPLGKVGGDFLDVFASGEGVTDYIIADISGHDWGAFVPHAALKALIRQNAALDYAPVENLKLTNRHLKEVMREGQYATLIYLRINRNKGTALLVNAGHVPALLSNNGELQRFDQPGDPIGCFDHFHPACVEIPLQGGERFLIYSDALIEEINGAPITRSAGLHRLQSALLDHADVSIDSMVGAVLDRLQPQPERMNDDLLIVAIEV